MCDLELRLEWVCHPGRMSFYAQTLLSGYKGSATHLEEWVYDLDAVDFSGFLHVF
jgi:hypothetical protein